MILMERVAGIEPALSVWKTDVLPLYDTRREEKSWAMLHNAKCGVQIMLFIDVGESHDKNQTRVTLVLSHL